MSGARPKGVSRAGLMLGLAGVRWCQMVVAASLAMACTDQLEFHHSNADAGATQPAPLGPPGAFHLTFDEECNGAAIDRSRFRTDMLVGTTEFRSWGLRQDYMADENVGMAAGDCVIRAENRANGGQPYTSGTLNTAGFFQQQFGFFEARVRAPAGNGLWTVVWLRSTRDWPPSIDLADIYGSAPGDADASYWWAGANGAASEVASSQVADFSADYHVFGVDWQPGNLTFYIDGAPLRAFQPPLAEIAEPLYPTFNLSVATPDGGRVAPDATTPWPAELHIDWLRVYAPD